MSSKYSRAARMKDDSMGLFPWTVIIGFLSLCILLLILVVSDPGGQSMISRLFG